MGLKGVQYGISVTMKSHSTKIRIPLPRNPNELIYKQKEGRQNIKKFLSPPKNKFHGNQGIPFSHSSSLLWPDVIAIVARLVGKMVGKRSPVVLHLREGFGQEIQPEIAPDTFALVLVNKIERIAQM